MFVVDSDDPHGAINFDIHKESKGVPNKYKLMRRMLLVNERNATS